MPKHIRVRKPTLRITKKGVRISPGSARIGGKKTGVNLSKKGASFSFKVPGGTYNTRKGCSTKLGMVAVAGGALVFMLARIVVA